MPTTITPTLFAKRLYTQINPDGTKTRFDTLNHIAQLLAPTTPAYCLATTRQLLNNHPIDHNFDYIGYLLSRKYKQHASLHAQHEGVVLTPQPILELCHELINPPPGGRLLDPCACVGRYPIVAANKHHNNRIDSIEYNPAFTHMLKANYRMHNIPGQIFTETDFLTKTPTPIYSGVFLNPPYTRREHEFINKALLELKPGRKLVALVPTKLVTASWLQKWRQKLYTNHTIESVTRFENNPFGNTTSGAIVAITIIAHQPHPADLIVKFHCYDNDLETFIARYRQPVLQENFADPNYVNTRITSRDEWYAYAFYRNTCPISVAVLAKATQERQKIPLRHDKKQNNPQEPFEHLFKLDEIFTITTPQQSILARELKPGNTPLYTETILNNGIHSYVDAEGLETFENVIIISGIGGRMFYVPKPSIATSQYNTILKHPDLTPESATYVCAVFNQEHLFGRGYPAICSRVKNRYLLLPAKHTKNGGIVPDWGFMHNTIMALTQPLN